MYLLVLSNGSYYAGYARDIRQRYRRHREGTASRLTRSFPPVRLAQCWKVRGGRSRAQQVEAFLKSCNRADKQRLVGDPQLLGLWLRQRRRLRIQPRPCLPGLDLPLSSY